MEIKPLRGYRYAGDMTRDLSTVVAPPYDQISAETQDRLYALSPHNIVRVTYPKDAADKYRRARDVLDGWLGEGVWRRDERPAIYPYDQTFSVAGQSVTRTGFVALGQVTDYARGGVRGAPSGDRRQAHGGFRARGAGAHHSPEPPPRSQRSRLRLRRPHAGGGPLVQRCPAG